MWSPLLNLLEGIARIRIPFVKMRTRMNVGRPNAPDARGTANWRNYLDAQALSRMWGPHPESPWVPFHCLTLFIALDYLRHEQVGPCAEAPWPMEAFDMPPWIDARTLLFVDLPGPQSVALGAALGLQGCDLVCTFNNWPHPKGVVRPEETLAALLRYASLLHKKRVAYATPAPVAWLCDSGRLSGPPGKPGQFDNRYYIEESVIPGINYLRERGISRVAYVTAPRATATPAKNGNGAARLFQAFSERPSPPKFIQDDLNVHLDAFQKAGFEVVTAVAADNGRLEDPQPYSRQTAPNFKTKGFFRSSAGGFGAPVPHPSSSG